MVAKHFVPHADRSRTRPLDSGAVIRLGINLPTFDPLGSAGRHGFVEAAQLAEQVGLDSVWVGDHLRMPAPGYDSTVALAAVAATTNRVKLGFAVMLLGLRQPAWAAKQLTTIDALAPGRLLLGVGVGGEFPEEFEAVGLSSKRRGRLLDDALAVLPDWLEGRSTPALAPTISRLPPIYVGGRGEPALQRAARVGDYWLPIWLTPDKLKDRMIRLAELAEQEGRPTPKLALALSVHVDADEGRRPPAGGRVHEGDVRDGVRSLRAIHAHSAAPSAWPSRSPSTARPALRSSCSPP